VFAGIDLKLYVGMELFGVGPFGEFHLYPYFNLLSKLQYPPFAASTDSIPKNVLTTTGNCGTATHLIEYGLEFRIGTSVNSSIFCDRICQPMHDVWTQPLVYGCLLDINAVTFPTFSINLKQVYTITPNELSLIANELAKYLNLSPAQVGLQIDGNGNMAGSLYADVDQDALTNLINSVNDPNNPLYTDSSSYQIMPQFADQLTAANSGGDQTNVIGGGKVIGLENPSIDANPIAHPVPTPTPASSASRNLVIFVGIGVGAALVVGAVALVLVRRRASTVGSPRYTDEEHVPLRKSTSPSKTPQARVEEIETSEEQD